MAAPFKLASMYLLIKFFTILVFTTLCIVMHLITIDDSVNHNATSSIYFIMSPHQILGLRSIPIVIEIMVVQSAGEEGLEL